MCMTDSKYEPLTEDQLDLLHNLGYAYPKLKRPSLSRQCRDENGALYQRFAGGWYLVEYNAATGKYDALRVPFRSIRNPEFVPESSYNVVG